MIPQKKNMLIMWFLCTKKGNDLKIAVDVGNGAAGAIIDDIFGELGLNYTVYQNAPDGFNINENCGSTSPQTLSKIVKDLVRWGCGQMSFYRSLR